MGSSFEQGERRVHTQILVNNAHQRPRDGGGFGVLNDVATVDDAGCALSEQIVGALQDFPISHLAAPTYEHRDAAGGFDHLVVAADVVRGIGLDHIGAQLNRLPYQAG
jgi:hypothetical protein